MKKAEAMEVAVKRSNLILEYIDQIFSGEYPVEASMKLGSCKIDGQCMCTLNITVPKTKFERHLNLGIPICHDYILCNQVLTDLYTKYEDTKEVQVGTFCTFRSMNSRFDGVRITSVNQTVIYFDFSSSYWYKDWREQQKNQQNIKTSKKR